MTVRVEIGHEVTVPIDYGGKRHQIIAVVVDARVRGGRRQVLVKLRKRAGQYPVGAILAFAEQVVIVGSVG